MDEQTDLTELLESLDSEIASLEAQQVTEAEQAAVDEANESSEVVEHMLVVPPELLEALPPELLEALGKPEEGESQPTEAERPKARRPSRGRDAGVGTRETPSHPLSGSSPRRSRPKSTKRELERRLRFLTKLREELEADPELFRFVDSFVGKRVEEAEQRQQEAFQAAERRQYAASVRLTAVSCVVSLGAGWLLSLLTPATVLARVLPR